MKKHEQTKSRIRKGGFAAAFMVAAYFCVTPFLSDSDEPSASDLQAQAERARQEAIAYEEHLKKAIHKTIGKQLVKAEERLTHQLKIGMIDAETAATLKRGLTALAGNPDDPRLGAYTTLVREQINHYGWDQDPGDSQRIDITPRTQAFMEALSPDWPRLQDHYPVNTDNCPITEIPDGIKEINCNGPKVLALTLYGEIPGSLESYNFTNGLAHFRIYDGYESAGMDTLAIDALPPAARDNIISLKTALEDTMTAGFQNYADYFQSVKPKIIADATRAAKPEVAPHQTGISP